MFKRKANQHEINCMIAKLRVDLHLLKDEDIDFFNRMIRIQRSIQNVQAIQEVTKQKYVEVPEIHNNDVLHVLGINEDGGLIKIK